MQLDPSDTKFMDRVIADLSRDIVEEVRDHHRAPAAALSMLSRHLSKPWVPGFWTILISPIMPTLRSYLKLSVMRASGRVWYFPSAEWWVSHARTAHHPDGSGCDVDAHVAYLTEGGKDSEFLYANLLRDSRLQVCGQEDFKAECEWWTRNVGKAAAP